MMMIPKKRSIRRPKKFDVVMMITPGATWIPLREGADATDLLRDAGDDLISWRSVPRGDGLPEYARRRILKPALLQGAAGLLRDDDLLGWRYGADIVFRGMMQFA